MSVALGVQEIAVVRMEVAAGGPGAPGVDSRQLVSLGGEARPRRMRGEAGFASGRRPSRNAC